jgi:hypothetical protein
MTELAAVLRAGHLTRAGLARWAGTERLSALPALVPALAARPVVPASALLALFVAGAEVEAELVAAPIVARADLVARAGNRVRARLALLPLGDALVACDRLDAPDERGRACWPDDSSYHLALALPPGPHARWIDLGCGSAFAQLWRPRLAAELAGADANPHVLARARLGAELAGVALALHEADVADGVPGTYELVSCNAPIPGGADSPMWRATGADFVPRLIAGSRVLAAPGATIVIHAALAALAALADEPGERVIVSYTPAGVPGFAVAWWRPDAAPLAITARRELTAERPHLTHGDRVAALRGEL